MKILYIGHYKEFGGWAQAATDYILALDRVGADVVCRNVTLTKDKPDVNRRILELEKKSAEGCNVCIQHVLPHHVVGTDTFDKNIAFLASESTSIKHLAWLEHLKQVDEVWVPNKDSQESLRVDGIDSLSVKVIPHTCNTEKYKVRHKQISLPEIDNEFKFYYIGDLNDRKNLEATIACYQSEFSSSDSVTLVLKVKKFGLNENQTSALVEETTKKVLDSLRMNVKEPANYLIVANELSEEEICSMHQYCDCFVCPSHGEAWSIPSFDAMAFGNTPICSNFGGPREFIDEAKWRTGHLIDGVFSVCRCSDAAFPDLFTGREYWFQPCEKQIKEAMRKAYNSWLNNKVNYKIRNIKEGLNQAEKFSYENIGKKMIEVIGE